MIENSQVALVHTAIDQMHQIANLETTRADRLQQMYLEEVEHNVNWTHVIYGALGGAAFGWFTVALWDWWRHHRG